MPKQLKNLNESIIYSLAKRVTALEAQPLTDIEEFCNCVDDLAEDLLAADCFDEHALQMHGVLDRIDEYIVIMEKESAREERIPPSYPFNLKDEEVDEFLSQLTNPSL